MDIKNGKSSKKEKSTEVVNNDISFSLSASAQESPEADCEATALKATGRV